MPTFIIPLSFLAFIILLNILIVRLIIKRALRKYIKPDLDKKELYFISYKWVIFFGIGDFTRENDSDAPNNGYWGGAGGRSPFLSIYIYIYYYNSHNIDKRVTARIDTLFFFIRKVKYSSEL